MGRDFNVVRFTEKKRKYQRLLASMRCFSQFIEEMCLKDLPLSGGLFTWCGGSNNGSASRLDRFLVLMIGRIILVGRSFQFGSCRSF